MTPPPPPRPGAPVVLTVGHSTRTMAQLVELLRAHRVGVLVDVRRWPRSRRHPQFSEPAFGEAIAAAGIEFVHEPELGGFRAPRPDSANLGWKLDAFRGYADR